MDENGLTTTTGLAKGSRLSVPTARRARFGDENGQLNASSASAIAELFGVAVGDINWPGGLANGGRPARSGGRYVRRSD